MVDDLHHLFSQVGLQTVVHAGDGKHGDHAGSVNSGGDDATDVVMESSADDTQHQGEQAQGTSYDVGDHVHDLFTTGVVG